jgi:HSP90 family molecular chaperone
MYVNPMTIYRKYIQNAADAIDDARVLGLLAVSDVGKVDITIDLDNRTVRIRDNGTGLPRDSFGSVMTAIGASRKRGTSARCPECWATLRCC